MQLAKSQTIVWLVFRLLVSLVPRLNLFATRSFKQRIKIDVTTRSSQLVTRLSQRLLAGLYCLIKTIPINLSFTSTNMSARMLYADEAFGDQRSYQLSTTEPTWEPLLSRGLKDNHLKHYVTSCTQIFNFTQPLPLAIVFVLSPDRVRFYPSSPGR